MFAFGPLSSDTLHLCIDIQLVFADAAPWHTPWMPRVLPLVRQIAEAHPEQTVFTRFMPVFAPTDACGSRRRYYERWRELTLERADPSLSPTFARLVPPAMIFDKQTYSSWAEPGFAGRSVSAVARLW